MQCIKSGGRCTEFISLLPAEQHCAGLATASKKEDHGKHINHPRVMGQPCRPLQHVTVRGVRLVSPSIPQLCLSRGSKGTIPAHLHGQGAEHGKCGFFLSSLTESYQPEWLGWWLAADPSFPPLLCASVTRALSARHEYRSASSTACGTKHLLISLRAPGNSHITIGVHNTKNEDWEVQGLALGLQCCKG